MAFELIRKFLVLSELREANKGTSSDQARWTPSPKVKWASRFHLQGHCSAKDYVKVDWMIQPRADVCRERVIILVEFGWLWNESQCLLRAFLANL